MVLTGAACAVTGSPSRDQRTVPMPTMIERPHRGVARYVSAFEGAWARDGRAEPGDFLPGHGDPLRSRVLRELVRAGLGLGQARGGRRTLGDYLAAYPELAADREAVEELAFEEYQLRRRAREEVSEAEYERRYGIDAFDWPYRLDEAGAARVSFGWSPAIDRATTAIRAADDVEPVARSYLEFRLGPEGEGGDVDAWCRSAGGAPGPAKLIRDLHDSDPAGAERFARAVATLPKPGDEFQGFRLVHELGRGAFGRVYLALAGRPGRPGRGAEGIGRAAGRVADPGAAPAHEHRADLLGPRRRAAARGLHAVLRLGDAGRRLRRAGESRGDAGFGRGAGEDARLEAEQPRHAPHGLVGRLDAEG